MNFQEFCDLNKNTDNQSISTGSTLLINYSNSSGEVFSVNPTDIYNFLNYIYLNYDLFTDEWEKIETKRQTFTNYEEKSYRAIYRIAGENDTLKTIGAAGKSQTKSLTMVITKLICFFSDTKYVSLEENTFFDRDSISKLLAVGNDFSALLLGEKNKIISDSAAREMFKSWLRTKGLSERTIKSYADTSINVIDSLLQRKVNGFLGVYRYKSELKIAEFSDILATLDEWNEKNTNGNGMYQAAINQYSIYVRHLLSLPKAFLLLAGISGTGKSRFVRKQAEASGSIDKNYKLISVRPDWHEPSDLLGYISRIKEEKYIVTDALKFMVSAWCDACDLVNTSEKVLANKAPSEMNTFWLCLDEMNLAPVEQYFADYLSVIETRKWKGDSYSCDAILKADVIKLLGKDAKKELRNDLGLTDIKYDSLWSYFSEIGIPLPPNVIVAGTVNMDETTHGFSRKVIDRALTLDFGQFFPNDFDAFFEPTSTPVIFSFPTLSQATQSDFNDIAADSVGQKSLAFLKGINEILKGTMFELAYRALNELFISVICIKPKTENELQAVWDDFLMTKVLPRIEGDDDKLKIHNDSNSNEILKALDEYIKQKLPLIYETELRPDFFRRDVTSNKPVEIKCRSRVKLKWMSDRLANNGFTTFWP